MQWHTSLPVFVQVSGDAGALSAVVVTWADNKKNAYYGTGSDFEESELSLPKQLHMVFYIANPVGKTREIEMADFASTVLTTQFPGGHRYLLVSRTRKRSSKVT